MADWSVSVEQSLKVEEDVYFSELYVIILKIIWGYSSGVTRGGGQIAPGDTNPSDATGCFNIENNYSLGGESLFVY